MSVWLLFERTSMGYIKQVRTSTLYKPDALLDYACLNPWNYLFRIHPNGFVEGGRAQLFWLNYDWDIETSEESAYDSDSDDCTSDESTTDSSVGSIQQKREYY